MYEKHWGLNRKPFATSTGADSYYPGESHQGALLKLRYAIENRRAAAVLAGNAGTGKSLLVHALLQQLPEKYFPRIHVVFPQMVPAQFIAFIADELSPETVRSTETPPVDGSVRRIRQSLTDNSRAGRHAILVVDEAHLLDELGNLESIRLLLNFETNGECDLTVILVGQPQVLADLDRSPGLEERIGVKCLLRPFHLEESISYVTHRMTVAGATQPVFDDGALQMLHEFSKGIPRRINRLADLALLVGFAEERNQVDAAQIEAVAREMIAVTPD